MILVEIYEKKKNYSVDIILYLSSQDTMSDEVPACPHTHDCISKRTNKERFVSPVAVAIAPITFRWLCFYCKSVCKECKHIMKEDKVKEK
jgi:hypothetical protein